MEKYIFLIIITIILSKTLEPKIEIYIESLCDDCIRFIKIIIMNILNLIIL